MRTRYGTELPDQLLCHYLDTLVAQFYKILPMRESEESTVKEFMSSLQVELIGVKGVIESLDYDERYLKLIAILQYLIDSDCDVGIVKREVFKSISLCKKLQDLYCRNESEV